MKYIPFVVLIFSLLLPQSRAADINYISPNKKWEITSKLLPPVPAFNDEAFLNRLQQPTKRRFGS